jgi:N-acylneuraminate cytidylyltransferase
LDRGAIWISRLEELAYDDAPMLPVLQDAVWQARWWFEDGIDWVLLLQPTTPFRTADDIRAAIALAEAGDCDSVISVVQVDDHHPARMYTIQDDYMKALYPDEETKRRQDLSPLYLRNGAIYLTRRDVIMGGSVWGKRIKPLVMPPERSVNIDSMLDWKLAEAMLVRD